MAIQNNYTPEVYMPEYVANHNYPHADLQRFGDLVFQGPEEFTGLVTIAKREKRSSGKIEAIASVPAKYIGTYLSKMNISETCDYYITKAQVKTPRRWRCSDLFCLNAIFIDIDCHRRYISENEIRRYCALIINKISGQLVADGLMYEPNMVIYTGRGIHLVWLIEQLPAKFAGIYRFVVSQYVTRIKELLKEDEQLFDYSVDESCSKRPMGLTRLPGTINTSASTYTQYEIFHECRIDLPKEFDNQLQYAIDNGYHADLGKKHKKKKRYAHADITVVGQRRIKMLSELKRIRGGSIDMGLRDKYLLIYFCACLMAGMKEDEALQAVFKENSSFAAPLKEKVLKGYLISAMRKHYRFRNETIGAWLDISEKERALIALHTSTQQSSKEKHAARDKRTAQRRARRDRKVIVLFKSGLSKAAIAREVGICFNTVARIIKDHIADMEQKQHITETEQQKADAQAAARRAMWKVYLEKYAPKYSAGPLESDTPTETFTAEDIRTTLGAPPTPLPA